MVKFFQKILAVVMALAMLNVQAYAAPFMGMDFSSEAQDLINFNEADIYGEFQEIAELSELLMTTELSAVELASENSSLLQSVNMESSLPLSADDSNDGPPLGIPSFLWGCILGWVGLLLVYILTDQNKDETKKALWGCVAGSLVGILFYVIVIGASAASSTSSSTY